MFEGPELDAAGRRIDDWQAAIEQRAAQARELAARLAALTATARSDDNLVTVRVGADGRLTGLELDERVRRRPAADTAAQILATLAAAQADLTAQATTVTEETVGADSETGRAVLASLTRRLS
jgi:DNA-binding protein YbaB